MTKDPEDLSIFREGHTAVHIELEHDRLKIDIRSVPRGIACYFKMQPGPAHLLAHTLNSALEQMKT